MLGPQKGRVFRPGLGLGLGVGLGLGLGLGSGLGSGLGLGLGLGLKLGLKLGLGLGSGLGFVAHLRQRLDGLGGLLQLADELGLLQRGGGGWVAS